MVDGKASLFANSLHQITAEPAGALARERRNHDLVDDLVIGCFEDRGVWIGMHDLPVCVDPIGAKDGDGATKSALGLRMVLRVALRRNDQEARLAGSVPYSNLNPSSA